MSDSCPGCCHSLLAAQVERTTPPAGRASKCCDNQESAEPGSGASSDCSLTAQGGGGADPAARLEEVRKVRKEGSGASPSGAMTTATTEPQICKETGTPDYEDDEGDCAAEEDIKTEEGAEESEEQIKEYLKRTDTAVIFPEPVSVFGLKDCLKNDEDQEEKKRGHEMKSKVAGSASEYLICSCNFLARKLLLFELLRLRCFAMLCDADAIPVPSLSRSVPHRPPPPLSQCDVCVVLLSRSLLSLSLAGNPRLSARRYLLCRGQGRLQPNGRIQAEGPLT